MTTIRIPKDARALRRGAMFLLSAVLTAALTPGGHAPFALGLLSAAGAGRDGAAALGGTVLGPSSFWTLPGPCPTWPPPSSSSPPPPPFGGRPSSPPGG